MPFSPAQQKSRDHSEPCSEGAEVVHVPPFADANSRVKGDWTFDNPLARCQGSVEEMRIKLQVDRRIQTRHEAFEARSTQHLISGSYIGKSTAAEMFELKQFSDEEIAVIHECRKLSARPS